MLANILQTRCMVLGSINLAMAIDTKEHGTREEGKVSVHTLSEVETHIRVIGKMGFLVLLAAYRAPLLGLPFHLTMQKSFMQFR